MAIKKNRNILENASHEVSGEPSEHKENQSPPKRVKDLNLNYEFKLYKLLLLNFLHCVGVMVLMDCKAKTERNILQAFKESNKTFQTKNKQKMVANRNRLMLGVQDTNVLKQDVEKQIIKQQKYLLLNFVILSLLILLFTLTKRHTLKYLCLYISAMKCRLESLPSVTKHESTNLEITTHITGQESESLDADRYQTDNVQRTKVECKDRETSKPRTMILSAPVEAQPIFENICDPEFVDNFETETNEEKITPCSVNEGESNGDKKQFVEDVVCEEERVGEIVQLKKEPCEGGVLECLTDKLQFGNRSKEKRETSEDGRISTDIPTWVKPSGMSLPISRSLRNNFRNLVPFTIYPPLAKGFPFKHEKDEIFKACIYRWRGNYHQTCKVYMLHLNPRRHPQTINGIPWHDFERETMRVASFSTYPETATQSPALLANSGFVYCGDGTSDKVICFFCYVQKENWKIDDDINEVHQQLNPHCPMNIVLQSNNAVSTSSSTGSVIHGASAWHGESSSAMASAVGNIAQSPHYPSESNTPELGRPSGNITNSAHQSNNAINPSLIPNSGLPAANPSTDSRHVNRRAHHHSVNPEATGHRAPDPNAHSGHPVINSQIYSIPRNPANPSSSASAGTGQQSSASAQLNLQDLGIFHERPRYPEYAILVKRTETFVGWDRENPQNPEELARAGFIYSGYLDSTKCFFCGLRLKAWTAEDDPFVEHACWGPSCGYLRQCKSADFIRIVQSIKAERGTPITVDSVRREIQRQGVDENNELEDSPVALDPAVRSVLETNCNRDDVLEVANELRDSGVTLSADVLLRELRRKRPGSTPANTGEDTVDGNAEERATITELKDENYTLRNNLICKVCMAKEVRIVFLPCGHLVACQECAVALLDCPVCRSFIRATVRATIR